MIALVLLFASFPSCQNSNRGAVPGAVNTTLPVADFESKLATAQGAQLLDVRTSQEFSQGHLKNAANVDINGDNFESTVSNLDKSKPVFLYCLSGGRSSHAATQMNEMGFKEVYNMDGGIMKWKGAGKPVEMGEGAKLTTGMSIEQFTKATSEANYVLVDFNAQWCMPCKKMMPILEHFADTRKDKLKLLKIDIENNKEVAIAKKVDEIPYMELYKDGKLVWSHKGLMDESDFLKETGL